MVVPYSNVMVVEELFAFTVPLIVTDVLVIFVAASVVAEGAVQEVENVWSDP